MLGLLVAIVLSALADLFHVDLVAAYADGALSSLTYHLNLVVSAFSNASTRVICLVYAFSMTL